MINKSDLSIFQCPICKNDLSQDGDYLVCVDGHRFPIVDGIIVFLTKDDLSGFLNDPWGGELQQEFLDCDPDFFFATNEDDIEVLQKICENEGEKAKKSRWALTDDLPDTETLGLPEEQRAAIDESRDEIAKLSRSSSANRVLDWPTGSGGCLKHLIHKVDRETLVVSLEVNFRTLAWTKTYFDENGFSGNMLFVVADARNMPFKDNVFQSVTAWGGTTEIENAEAGLTETFRVLERNG